MLNIAIIGTGFGSKVHIPGWSQVPGTQVTTLVGHNFPKTKLIAEKHNIPHVFSSWQKAVVNSNIDIISIATPPHLQKTIALAALKNNKSILSEKPFSINISEIEEIAKIAKKSTGKIAVDFEFRYIPHFIALKKLLIQKSIGEIRLCKINWITGGRAKDNMAINWMNFKKFGGGILLNYGSHVIDYLEWLISPISSISANLKIIKTNPLKKITADDYCHFSVRLKNGTQAQITITNVLYGGEGHFIEIYGSKGTLKLFNNNLFDPIKNFTLIKIDTNNKIKTIKIKTNYSDSDGRIIHFSELAKDFIKSIKNKKAYPPSLIDCIRVHKVMAAIRKSDQLKKIINI